MDFGYHDTWTWVGDTATTSAGVFVSELQQLCPSRLLMRSCGVRVCEFLLRAGEECFFHCLLLSSQSDTGLPTVCIYRTEGIFFPSTFFSLLSSDKALHSPVLPRIQTVLFLYFHTLPHLFPSPLLCCRAMPCGFSDVCCWLQSGLNEKVVCALETSTGWPSPCRAFYY